VFTTKVVPAITLYLAYCTRQR